MIFESELENYGKELEEAGFFEGFIFEDNALCIKNSVVLWVYRFNDSLISYRDKDNNVAYRTRKKTEKVNCTFKDFFNFVDGVTFPITFTSYDKEINRAYFTCNDGRKGNIELLGLHSDLAGDGVDIIFDESETLKHYCRTLIVKGTSKDVYHEYIVRRIKNAKEFAYMNQVNVSFEASFNDTKKICNVEATKQKYNLHMEFPGNLSSDEMKMISQIVAEYLFLDEYKLGVEKICYGFRTNELSNKLFKHLSISLVTPAEVEISRIKIEDGKVTDYFYIIPIDKRGECKVSFTVPMPFKELAVRRTAIATSMKEILDEHFVNRQSKLQS